MQMSKTEVFVFVEGSQDDPYFYAELCGSASRGRSFLYEIRCARELSDGSGGKQGLLSFHAFLVERAALTSTLQGKKTIAMFYLDKDIDDILGRQVGSAHVVYTKYYDIQNHIFEEGDLVQGAAVAASMDRRLLEPGLSDRRRWCRDAAMLWKEWVTVCVLVMTARIPSRWNYGSPSKINTGADGSLDDAKYQALLDALERASGLSSEEFKGALAEAAESVDECCARGEQGRVFKGKWYADLLAKEVNRAAAGRPYNSVRLKSRLTGQVLGTVDLEGSWADYLRAPLESMVSRELPLTGHGHA